METPWFDRCAERRAVSGSEVPWRYGEIAHEVAVLRSSVTVSALPQTVAVRVRGEHAGDVLDRVLPGEVFLREGQARPALLLGDDATIVMDLYLLAEEDGYLLFGEGRAGARDALLAAIAGNTRAGESAEVLDLTDSHTALSLNGPFAWELLADVEGPELIAFPYLSFYKPDAGRTYVRAGKTGEFGYDLLVPRERAGALWTELLAKGRAFDVAPAGVGSLWQCALENWWFNVHAEGGHAGATPLELQLQWRVNFRKDAFVGAEALRARKAAAGRMRLTPVVATGPLGAGDAVMCAGERIGTIANSVWSSWAERWIAAAMLDERYAQSGITRYEAQTGAGPIALRTVSAPFVNNLSLVVSPQRHTYTDRARISPPPHARF